MKTVDKRKRREFFVLVDGEQVDLADTEFVDIEEDSLGRDLMTFNYKEATYKSLVYRH
jgi:archaellum component FlaG (FlaF/FlaG flagellin family)